MDIISKSDHHQSPRSTISNHFSLDIIKRMDETFRPRVIIIVDSCSSELQVPE